MNKIILGMVLITLCATVEAREAKLEFLKPYVTKILGAEIAEKIWGNGGLAIQLPAIPIVNQDAKSIDAYKEYNEKIKFSKKKMTQYNISFVNELVRVTRETEANNDDLNKWMGALDQGATREGIYRALVLDEYYSRLENYNDVVSDKAIEFSIEILKKYTNKKVPKKNFLQLNIYSVKRIVTERLLEVMDAYLLEDKESLFDWYAVYSSELASRKNNFASNLRKEEDSSRHKRWSKRVPLQFIKSELILKTHKMLNTLQKNQSN